ncbi:hypothetical protein EDD16DRAFT_1570278 [Pisolithus croceorrhizus]|nr:hypothetical protein EDD16DRAFT_1570278 [Pisolithus croceorrhizus]
MGHVGMVCDSIRGWPFKRKTGVVVSYQSATLSFGSFQSVIYAILLLSQCQSDGILMGIISLANVSEILQLHLLVLPMTITVEFTTVTFRNASIGQS